MIDTFKGEIHTGHGKVLLDKSIVNELNFIREGEFKEKNGAPALKLVGKITDVVDISNVPKTDSLYPYRFGDFKDKFKINN